MGDLTSDSTVNPTLAQKADEENYTTITWMNKVIIVLTSVR